MIAENNIKINMIVYNRLKMKINYKNKLHVIILKS